MIDSHIHLYDERYELDLPQIIDNAKLNDVSSVIVVACGIKEIEKAIKLKHEYGSFINLAFGFHPVDVSSVSDGDLIILESLIKENEIVAIGEIGLDYHWYPEEKEQQIELLRKQLDLADRFNLPIIIHNRESTNDLYAILKEYPGIIGVIHSFSEDSTYAKKFIELGYKIGISGPVTFKNGLAQKDTVKNIGLEHILLETDGPYLTPEPFRGKLNMPHYIEYIAAEIAFQKKISIEEVKSQTKKNTIELFGINEN